jgi:hypothetical protein
MKTQEYILVAELNIRAFQKEVQTKLDNGFRLHGNTFIWNDAVCQAIVKEIPKVISIDVSKVPAKDVDAYIKGATDVMASYREEPAPPGPNPVYI